MTGVPSRLVRNNSAPEGTSINRHIDELFTIYSVSIAVFLDTFKGAPGLMLLAEELFLHVRSVNTSPPDYPFLPLNLCLNGFLSPLPACLPACLDLVRSERFAHSMLQCVARICNTKPGDLLGQSHISTEEFVLN